MARSRTSRTCGQRSGFTGTTAGYARRDTRSTPMAGTARPLVESARRLPMNRRDSLRALSAVTAHALFPSVLAAAAEAAAGIDTGAAVWTPRAIRPERAAMLEALVDTVLPATDTPGAREARVHLFVDLALRDCYTPAEQKLVFDGLEALGAESAAK